MKHVWYCSKVMKAKDVQKMARAAKENLAKKKATCVAAHIA